MPTRKYNLGKRRRKQAELKARIATATAELHASKGAADTSYADIARKAGVSLPTVHSHFPTQTELFAGCTSHVAEHAPVVPVDEILQAATLSEALELLIGAIEAQHLYYEPWSARRMEGYVPFLAEMSAAIRQGQANLVARILKQFLGPGRRRKTVATCETLLSFDSWHRLVRGHGISLADTRQILRQTLLAIVEPGTTLDKSSTTRRKTQ